MEDVTIIVHLWEFRSLVSEIFFKLRSLKYTVENNGSVINTYAVPPGHLGGKGEMVQQRNQCWVLFWHSQAWVFHSGSI